MALRAGNDIMMTTPQFYEGAIEAVRSGRLKESEIDEPVKRLLALKFRMGLFENPRRPDLAKAAAEVARPDHRAAVLDAARQSLVLLQNGGLLPLDPAKVKSIAVVGPNADDDLQQLGDWSLGSPQHPPEAGKHPREKTVTVLDGIKAASGGHGPLREGLLDQQRRPLRAARRRRRGPGLGRRRRGRGRPPRLHRRGEEHGDARAAGRAAGPARRAGEDRQAAGRGAGEQQAARAAAFGQARRGDPRGLQPRHGGRARRRRGAVRPAQPVGQAHRLVPGARRPAAGLLQPGARPARQPLRRPDAGAAVPVRPRPELHARTATRTRGSPRRRSRAGRRPRCRSTSRTPASARATRSCRSTSATS